MTPAFDLPARPMSFPERLRPHRSQAVLGLALGVAVEVLLDGAPFGLGHALFAVLLATAIVVHAGKEAWQSAGAHRGLLLGAVLLFGSTALHTATWLSVMSVAAAVLLFSLAIAGWNGERSLGTLRTGQLLGAPFKLLGQSMHAGARVTQRELENAHVGSVVNRYGPGALRLVLIVVPPVLGLTLLLGSGDAVFRARLESLERALFGIPLDGFVRGGFVTAFSAMCLAGVLALASRRRVEVPSSAPGRGLKAFESFTLLATLTSLLLVFGLATTPCALAPAACELPAGVTYAEAAHEGFFQLLFAAVGILALLMALPARTQLTSKGAERTFTALSTALVLATMPMLISGGARLWRYESIYGLTVLRLLAEVGLVLVGAVLAWRALTLWTLRASFVAGALGLFTSTLLGLAVLAPDAYIAERNVQHARLDIRYLLSLSDEALPALVASFDRLPEYAQQEARGALAQHSERLGEDTWLTWNRGRARAFRAVTAYAP